MFDNSSDLQYWLVLDSQENPELIWNDESREKVSEIVETMTNR